MLWAEAMNFVVWVKNRTLTRILGNTTPLEKLTGQKPNLAGVPEWGQRVWVHTAANSKLDVRAILAHWIGYNKESTHAHWIYWPELHKVSVERDVRFTAGQTTITIQPTSSSPAPSTPAPTTLSLTPTTVTIPSIPTQVASAPQLPPAATDSREEEIKVEDELADIWGPPATQSAPVPQAPSAP